MLAASGGLLAASSALSNQASLAQHFKLISI